MERTVRMSDEKPRRARGKLLERRKQSAGQPSSKAEQANPNASRLMLVVNPASGTGEVVNIWDELVTTLRDLALDFDFKFTERPGHAVEISIEAARAGYGTIVVVGGDGTVFEATNGIMAVEREHRPKLGVIPTGRGSDFCRTLKIPLDRVTAASFLASGKSRTIDVAWMEYRATDGVRTGYFANIAGLGFDGEVTERANNLPERLCGTLGGTGTYLLSLLVTFARYKEKDVELHVDDKAYRVVATSIVIANCRFFGGKMCIAPNAVCDDGLFDIVVIGAGFGRPILDEPPGTSLPRHSALRKTVAKIKMAGNVRAVYKGRHVEDESVLVLRGKKVRVASTDRMVLQADGEVIGEGPFAAEVIEGAIDVIAL